MSFPRYEKYKDSGLEWLREVPEHWETWKLPHAFSSVGSGTTPKSENVAYYEDGKIPWLNTGDLNDSELSDCGKRITELALVDNSSLKVYPAGSLATAMYCATIRRANVEEIRNLIVVYPPRDEQVWIASFLGYKVAKFDALTSEAQTAINLLQERRTALISAAVTGKIDVRGLVAEQPKVEVSVLPPG